MRLPFAILLVGAMASPAFAQQPKTYNFTMNGLTVDQANMVLNTLGNLPWAQVNPILVDLIKQLNAQNAPPVPSPAPADPSKE